MAFHAASQALVFGDNKPYNVALLVPDFAAVADHLGLDETDQKKVPLTWAAVSYIALAARCPGCPNPDCHPPRPHRLPLATGLQLVEMPEVLKFLEDAVQQQSVDQKKYMWPKKWTVRAAALYNWVVLDELPTARGGCAGSEFRAGQCSVPCM